MMNLGGMRSSKGTMSANGPVNNSFSTGMYAVFLMCLGAMLSISESEVNVSQRDRLLLPPLRTCTVRHMAT